MKDNRGFTLIELIIVMIIVGVLSVGTLLSFHVLEVRSIKSTVSRINTMLDFVQLENMTKSGSYFFVITEDGGNYYLTVQKKDGEERTIRSKEKLDLKRGEISFQYKDGTEYLIHSTEVEGREKKENMEIGFLKETGGIRTDDTGNTVSRINIMDVGITYSISLVEATGKHYIE